MSAKISKQSVLLARASVARRLVRDGQLDGPLALSLVVDPPERLLAVEARLPDSTVTTRAYSQRYG